MYIVKPHVMLACIATVKLCMFIAEQDCQDNTGGVHCDVCAAGYYSLTDVIERLYCQPCACPMTIPSNK